LDVKASSGEGGNV